MSPLAALLFPTVGLQEILVILLLVGLFFGAKKIPELGRGIGEGIRNFRKGLRGHDEETPADKPAGKDAGQS